MVNNNKKQSKEVWTSLGLYGGLSLNLGAMVLGGFYLGRYLETHFHLANMSFTGILVGLGLGFYEMFAIALKMAKK